MVRLTLTLTLEEVTKSTGRMISTPFSWLGLGLGLALALGLALGLGSGSALGSGSGFGFESLSPTPTPTPGRTGHHDRAGAVVDPALRHGRVGAPPRADAKAVAGADDQRLGLREQEAGRAQSRP